MDFNRRPEKETDLKNGVVLRHYKELTEDKGDMLETFIAVEKDTGRELVKITKKEDHILTVEATRDAQDSGLLEEVAKKAGIKEEDINYTDATLSAAQAGVDKKGDKDDESRKKRWPEAESTKLVKSEDDLPDTIKIENIDLGTEDQQTISSMKKLMELVKKHTSGDRPMSAPAGAVDINSALRGSGLKKSTKYSPRGAKPNPYSKQTEQKGVHQPSKHPSEAPGSESVMGQAHTKKGTGRGLSPEGAKSKIKAEHGKVMSQMKRMTSGIREKLPKSDERLTKQTGGLPPADPTKDIAKQAGETTFSDVANSIGSAIGGMFSGPDAAEAQTAGANARVGKSNEPHPPGSPEDSAHDVAEGAPLRPEIQVQQKGAGVRKMFSHLREKRDQSAWDRSPENAAAGEDPKKKDELKKRDRLEAEKRSQRESGSTSSHDSKFKQMTNKLKERNPLPKPEDDSPELESRVRSRYKLEKDVIDFKTRKKIGETRPGKPSEGKPDTRSRDDKIKDALKAQADAGSPYATTRWNKGVPSRKPPPSSFKETYDKKPKPYNRGDLDKNSDDDGAPKENQRSYIERVMNNSSKMTERFRSRLPAAQKAISESNRTKTAKNRDLAKLNRIDKYNQSGVDLSKIALDAANSPEWPGKGTLFSDGNTKLMKDGIISFNLPAGHTCDRKADCFGFCYAMQGPMSWDAALKSRATNWGRSAREDFVDMVDAELKKWPKIKTVKVDHDQFSKIHPDRMKNITNLVDDFIIKKNKKTGEVREKTPAKKFKTLVGDHVRIHDSGDFYHQDYIDKWVEIAKRHPDKKFLAYTKAHALHSMEKLNSLPNFCVRKSVGGQDDHKIDTENDPHAQIFESDQALDDAGYVNGTNSDIYSFDKNIKKIGLSIHGNLSSNYDKDKHGKKLKKSGSRSIDHIPVGYLFDQIDAPIQYAMNGNSISHMANKIHGTHSRYGNMKRDNAHLINALRDRPQVEEHLEKTLNKAGNPSKKPVAADETGGQHIVDLGIPHSQKGSTYKMWNVSKEDLGNVLKNWDNVRWDWALPNKKQKAGEQEHGTTINRRLDPKTGKPAPATPLRDFYKKNPEAKHKRTLYHGMGKDSSGLEMAAERSAKAHGYDPYHSDPAVRKKPRGKYDMIHSHFTLNVVNKDIGKDILTHIHSLLSDKGTAAISVRNDGSLHNKFKALSGGLPTKKTKKVR